MENKGVIVAIIGIIVVTLLQFALKNQKVETIEPIARDTSTSVKVAALGGSTNLIEVIPPTETPEGTPTPTITPTPPIPNSFSTNLLPLNDSNIVASATFTEIAGQVEIVVTSESQAAKDTNTIFIVSLVNGSCAEWTDVKHPLNNLTSTKSISFLPTTIAQLKSELPLTIHIFRGNSEKNSAVSCGRVDI